MGEGLQRVALAVVCSRAPWGGTVTRGWGAEPKAWTLTEDEVRATYAAIVEGKGKAGICAALAVEGLSEDKASRCLQMLRKAKLIKYVTGVGWVRADWIPSDLDDHEA
jgi:hypothetical protein